MIWNKVINRSGGTEVIKCWGFTDEQWEKLNETTDADALLEMLPTGDALKCGLGVYGFSLDSINRIAYLTVGTSCD